jgi:hypothetical protein
MCVDEITESILRWLDGCLYCCVLILWVRNGVHPHVLLLSQVKTYNNFCSCALYILCLFVSALTNSQYAATFLFLSQWTSSVGSCTHLLHSLLHSLVLIGVAQQKVAYAVVRGLQSGYEFE